VSAPDVQDVATKTEQVADVARKDFNFLAMLSMPGDFLFNFPAFYLVLFALLTGFKQKVERFAIGIPRGFAKTTFIKIVCVWYVLFSHKHFILIIGASESKAVNILSDICDMLSSPNIRRVFGNWDANIESNTQTTKVFHFRGREIVLWAVGAGTSVRGINRKNKRPDVMVMDDIQDREDAKNKEIADNLVSWMLSTLMKARSPFGCTYIFIGNMYPQNSILEKLKNNHQWKSLIVGGITSEGESLWEELKPIQELLDEYESDTLMNHPEVFISEVLNSTEIALASGIDISQIPYIPEYLLSVDSGEGSFILIDPSSGKKSGDDCSISHYEVMDEKPVFDELLTGTFTPLETIRHAIGMGLRRNTRLIGVEGVAYQSTLLFWFEKYCEDEGISGFHFVELSPKGQAKNNRIKRGLTKLLAGEIYLHPNVRSLVVSQIVDWNPLKVNNTDDVIDPIGYIEEILRDHPGLVIRDIFNLDSGTAAAASHSEDIEMPF
jgi:hypothetical protein